ncbi:hypothetical protein [Oerskovia turbata]
MNALSDEPAGLLPQGLRDDLESLRDPWGLFVDPTYYDLPGSFYATAMIDGSLAAGPQHAIEPSGAGSELCVGTEAQVIGEPWYTWAAAQVLPGREASCLSRDRPEATGDPSHDVPQLYAWASASTSSTTDHDAVRSAVERELAAAGRARVDSPYVMWRWDQLEDALDLSSTAAQRPAAAPSELVSPEGLMELWGYTMRCDARPATCDPTASLSDDLEVTRAGIAFGDSISLAGAIGILQARGADEQVSVLKDVVDARRDSATGLVRDSGFRGQIASSYKVFLLDHEMYPGPVPEVTSEELRTRLEQVPQDQTLIRMQAIVLLHAVDRQAFRQFQSEVDGVRKSLEGAVVTRDDLEHQVELAIAVAQVSEAPTLHLELFPVDDDESKFLARKAVASWTLFDNGKEIVSVFSSVRDEALKEAENPTEPVNMYVAGLSALRGPGLSISPEQGARIADAASALQGCQLGDAWSDKFFRFSVDKSSSCSLDILLEVSQAGYGVYP